MGELNVHLYFYYELSVSMCVAVRQGQAALKLSFHLAQPPKWEYKHEFFYTWL